MSTAVQPTELSRVPDVRRTAPDRWSRAWWSRGVPMMLARLGLVLVVLAIWQFASDRLVSAFFISSPQEIGAQLVDWIQDGALFTNLAITLEETILGLLLGATAGIAMGFLLGSSPFLSKLIEPFITAVYSLPKVALAPLFVLWLGIGVLMKVVLAAVIVFFLVFWNTYSGVRDADSELIDVMRVMGAKRRHIQMKIVLPGAISWIYVGLKLAVPYALVGAVVGELIASNQGMGYLLQTAAGRFDTAALFAALFVLMIVATLMNEILNRTEARVLHWKTRGGTGNG